MKQGISFLLPTKNEESTIGKIIEEIKLICQTHAIKVNEIIITDDSNDGTRNIARSHGAVVIIGGGRGLGTAMLKGLKYAIQTECEAVVTIDADGQVDLSEIVEFIKTMREKKADLVLGSRFLKPGLIDYNYRWINRFGTIVLSRILSKFTKLHLTDSHGGIRVWSPEVIAELEMLGTHTYVQETIIDAKEKGFKIIEIPSKWLKRKEGESRVVLSIPKYVFYTLPILILRSGNHIRYLFNGGIFLILMSFAHITTVTIQTNFDIVEMFERRTFVLFLLLFSTGLNLFLFGVIIEFISNLRRKSL